MTAAPEERDEDFVEEEEAEAAQEAAAIGGTVAKDTDDPAEAPLIEGGEGESEGFELAEEELIDHASHGDQQSAHVVIRDAGAEEDALAAEQTEGEADHERSSEEEDQD